MTVDKLLPLTQLTVGTISSVDQSPPLEQVIHTSSVIEVRARGKSSHNASHPHDRRHPYETPPIYLHLSNPANKHLEEKKETIFDGYDHRPRKCNEDIAVQVEFQCRILDL